ncbi:MAG: tRNA-dihydrouridine synthase B [Myxococcota bacterium]|jgi:tRNA-dihydrouridine synthase B
MSGVTDSPFRRIVKHASGDAVGMVMSEFISIEMLTAKQLRSMIRMSFDETERPVAIQLYGADPGRMAEAAKMVEDTGADLVDINCGCPAPKIVRRGGGAGLLKDLPNLSQLIDATVNAVSIPVTIKIRNGWCDKSINAMETLRVAENHGARAIAVHGRTRQQLYRGEADWDIIREMKSVASIPVLGSGDIMCADDALTRFRETGCDGVMIGRGAINNPWIFRQIADEVAGRTPFLPTWRDTIELLELYRAMLDAQYPAKVAPARLKMMLSRLLKGFEAGTDVRRTCLRLNTADEMIAYLWQTCGELDVLDVARDAATYGGAAGQGVQAA